jgi:hypothetical protein
MAENDSCAEWPVVSDQWSAVMLVKTGCRLRFANSM